MAEVITSWPKPKPTAPAQFVYPWEQWARLDENGVGDIWLAEQGVDFPEDMVPVRFRAVLYNRANRETNKREKNAPLIPKRVTLRNKRTGDTRETVRRVPDFLPLRVKVVIVSPELIAFQFFQGYEAPPVPEAIEVAIPQRRRPIHSARNRRTLEMAGV